MKVLNKTKNLIVKNYWWLLVLLLVLDTLLR
jgi:hypothetical protein